MEVLNILLIYKTLIHMFLIYCLVNQAVLKLHVTQLAVIIFVIALSGVILYYLLDE